MIRRIVILVATIIVLAFVNFEIYQKEQQLANGTTVFLELAPLDPRSLMQGDYMILRYQIARLPALYQVEKDGYLVIERDENQVASFKRIYDAKTPLSAGELLLRYRKQGHEIQLGAESFFFQEGHASYYEKAHYGELHLTSSGESILVGLRDAEFNALGPSE